VSPRRAWTGAALVLFAAACAHAAPAPPCAALLGDESVAGTDDARALLVNPAAIGQRHPAGTWLGYSKEADGAEAYAVLAAWRRLAWGWTRERDRANTFGLGFSLGSEQVRLGWSSALRAAAAPRAERDLDATAGLLCRPRPWLSAGGRVAHVFEPTLGGARVPREYTMSLGMRPLALARERAHDAGVRLTLLGEVSLDEGGSREAARVSAGVAIEPVAGLELRFTARDHDAFTAGVTLRGVRGSSSSSQARVRGERAGESWALASHGGEERTAFASRRDRRVATMRLSGVLTDQALGGGLLGGSAGRPSGVHHRQLERALEDPLTRGVFVELDGVAGMAQLEELRPRIQRLVQAGKPVVAWLPHGGSRGDLYLASAASRVFASPAAEFVGLGLRAERRYYRQALARLGVRLDRTSAGDYKSAYRNYSVDSMPRPDSVVIEGMLGQRQKLFVDAVTAGRGIPGERLLPVLDGRSHPAAVLAKLGVVDSVGWREEALAELGRLAGLGARPRTADLRRTPEARVRWATPRRIALVYAGGAIVDGRSGSNLLDGDVMGAETVVAQLERAFKAPDVNAVVLRIESPGGSASASHLLDHTVERLRRETGKPLVVSMGGVAASGGYFMSLHADRIFAGKHTVTGSIGVVYVKPSFEGAYAKLGVRQQDLERGDHMRGLSFARDWGPREQASADSAVRRLYRTFVDRVREARKLEPFEAHGFAQGRAWMGEDAAQRRLVDGIGGLEAAIAEARRLGGVPARERISYMEFGHPRGTLIERMLRSWVRNELLDSMTLPDLTRAQARAADWLEAMAEE
jgi:protease-4